MKEIFEAITEFTQEITDAVKKATGEFRKALPYQVVSQIKSINALNVTTGTKMSAGTLERYLNATSVDIDGSGNVIVELDPTDWLVNAMEDGISAFDMKETHLKSNYKLSKSGYRYKVIPLNVEKGASKNTNGRHSEKSQNIRQSIDKALKKPEWTNTRTSILPNTNQGQKISRLKTLDPQLSGLYKIEKFADAGSMTTGGKASGSKMVMFRMMTDDPVKSAGKWQHPGFEAKDIFSKLEVWLDSAGEALLEEILENELEKLIDMDGE